nr:DNA ligase [Paenibacillus hamazuiensis]
MLAAPGTAPFDDDNYIFEPKWDGARIQLHKNGDRVEAYARNGANVTFKFPELAQAADAIDAHSAILDCEGICLRDGRPAFDDFAYRLRLSHSLKIEQALRTHPATFVAFDVLFSGGDSLLNEPLMERKRRLQGIIRPSALLTPTMYREGDGRVLFEQTDALGLEGIVAKRKHSLYVPGSRTADWLKFKHVRTIDTVVLGYRMEPFELVLGLHFRTVKNKPVASVSSGISEEMRRLFLELAQPLHAARERGVQRLEPRLVCRIQYADRTDTHQLKETSFVRFVPDKAPEDCVWPG